MGLSPRSADRRKDVNKQIHPLPPVARFDYKVAKLAEHQTQDVTDGVKVVGEKDSRRG
jgi:hypothetical protein